MPSLETYAVTQQTVNQFDAVRRLPAGSDLDPQVNGGLKKFFKNVLGASPGGVEAPTVQQFVEAVAGYESDWPLYSTQPFRYPVVPRLPDQHSEYGADSTVRSALLNMRFMIERFGHAAFAATNHARRTDHAVTWGASLDEDYEFRIRGGSGAGAFSIDIGLGLVDRTGSRPSYKELWRAGIDTVHTDGLMGARFIRTGSGIKGGDTSKQEAFSEFRKRHRIMPQRLLGLAGLYFMRELDPDYALALSTQGARRLSTLGRSRSECDYTGIFTGVGFLPSDDPNWLLVPNFADGFYAALERSDLKKHEAHRLHEAVEEINNMTVISASTPEAAPQLFQLCSVESKQTLEREIAVALPALPTEAESN